MEFIDLKSQQARIRDDIEKRLSAVLDHGRYILGPEVAELEERLADYVGTSHCLTVASGTDALLMALMALEIGPGDEVITVPYTWISTAEVIALLGAFPVFVDVEPSTWNLDPEKLEAAISERTRAIMPVGIFGQTADMTAINLIAERHGLPVIEDAAQSFGATHRGRRSGGLSTIGTTSFFPSKPLGCYGDGGAIFTDDDTLAERMRWIRVHGQERKHYHPILGINGRFDTVQAAVLLSKLEIFEDEIRARQSVAAAYIEALRPLGDAYEFQEVVEGNTSVWAQFTLLCPDRDALSASLREAGVPSVSYYAVPLHLQPVFHELGHEKGAFPVSEAAAERGLSLPMSAYVSAEEVAQIAAACLGAS